MNQSKAYEVLSHCNLDNGVTEEVLSAVTQWVLNDGEYMLDYMCDVFAELKPEQIKRVLSSAGDVFSLNTWAQYRAESGAVSIAAIGNYMYPALIKTARVVAEQNAEDILCLALQDRAARRKENPFTDQIADEQRGAA